MDSGNLTSATDWDGVTTDLSSRDAFGRPEGSITLAGETYQIAWDDTLHQVSLPPTGGTPLTLSLDAENRVTAVQKGSIRTTVEQRDGEDRIVKLRDGQSGRTLESLYNDNGNTITAVISGQETNYQSASNPVPVSSSEAGPE